MIPPFQLHRPGSLAEAVGLLAQLGGDARIHAGGTELILMLREGFLAPGHLIDIKRVAGLAGVRLAEDGARLIVGATARHADIAQNTLVRSRFPALARLESVLANQRVRNSGTIGGNLAFAEPHGDPPALLVVADAEIRLESAAGSRTVPLDGWIRGPFDPDLAPDELLAEIQIPIPAPGTSFGYERFRALERPSVTVAARIDVGESGQIVDVRIVVGCVAGYAQRIRGAEGILRGRLLEELEGLLPAASGAASEEVEAATDSHGPEDYKRHLAGVLLGRALRRAVQDRLAAPPAGMRR